MKLLLLIIVPAVLLIWLTPLSAEAKTFKTDSYSVNIPNGCKTESEENRFSDDAMFECKSKGYAFQFDWQEVLILELMKTYPTNYCE